MPLEGGLAITSANQVETRNAAPTNAGVYLFASLRTKLSKSISAIVNTTITVMKPSKPQLNLGRIWAGRIIATAELAS